MKTFYYFKAHLGVKVQVLMKLKWIIIVFTVLFFFVMGFLILYDNYTRVGIWFQLSDLHHETFALSSIVFAIGILIGAIIVTIKNSVAKH
jgi:hypothetical protein